MEKVDAKIQEFYIFLRAKLISKDRHSDGLGVTLKKSGKPDAVNANKIWPFLIPVIKKLKIRMDVLVERKIHDLIGEALLIQDKEKYFLTNEWENKQTFGGKSILKKGEIKASYQNKYDAAKQKIKKNIDALYKKENVDGLMFVIDDYQEYAQDDDVDEAVVYNDSDYESETELLYEKRKSIKKVIEDYGADEKMQDDGSDDSEDEIAENEEDDYTDIQCEGTDLCKMGVHGHNVKCQLWRRVNKDCLDKLPMIVYCTCTKCEMMHRIEFSSGKNGRGPIYNKYKDGSFVCKDADEECYSNVSDARAESLKKYPNWREDDHSPVGFTCSTIGLQCGKSITCRICSEPITGLSDDDKKYYMWGEMCQDPSGEIESNGEVKMIFTEREPGYWSHQDFGQSCPVHSSVIDYDDTSEDTYDDRKVDYTSEDDDRKVDYTSEDTYEDEDSDEDIEMEY